MSEMYICSRFHVDDRSNYGEIEASASISGGRSRCRLASMGCQYVSNRCRLISRCDRHPLLVVDEDYQNDYDLDSHYDFVDDDDEI